MVKDRDRLERQMARRGWSWEQVAEAVRDGARFPALNRETNRPATRYVHPVTGRSVVLDDVSGEVIHVAAMTSAIETIHVRLLDDPVEVWRPAQAVALGHDVYRLADQDVPPDEVWEFHPGEEVVTNRRGTGAESFLAAIARATPPRRMGSRT